MHHQPGRSARPAEPGTKVCATTDDVLIDNVLKVDNINMNSAMFKPGAHTFWHSHADGQVMMVSSGRGIVVNRDGERCEVRAGDVVYTPPGEDHWHGAAPDCFVTYMSISLGQTLFGQPVEDADYDASWD